MKMTSSLWKLFASDQIEAMGRGGMRGVYWSTQTVKKALQLRFASGTTGYKMLLQQGHPFPSVRTLQRRMSNVNFQSGIIDDIFDSLSTKVSQMH